MSLSSPLSVRVQPFSKNMGTIHHHCCIAFRPHTSTHPVSRTHQEQWRLTCSLTQRLPHSFFYSGSMTAALAFGGALEGYMLSTIGFTKSWLVGMFIISPAPIVILVCFHPSVMGRYLTNHVKFFLMAVMLDKRVCVHPLQKPTITFLLCPLLVRVLHH